jgi:hypothetical protein
MITIPLLTIQSLFFSIFAGGGASAGEGEGDGNGAEDWPGGAASSVVFRFLPSTPRKWTGWFAAVEEGGDAVKRSERGKEREKEDNIERN